MIVRFAGRPRQLMGTESVQIQAGSIRELLQKLSDKLGEPFNQFVNGQRELDNSVTILKNGRNVLFLQKLDTPLEEGDEVYIMSQIAGG